MLVPSIGYNKYLIPPPLQNEDFTFIDLIANVRETIYIDEEKKYMRLKQQNTKEWFNSYLTFRNIRETSSRNLVTKDDMENMWLPLYNDVNSLNIPLKLHASSETLKIIPKANFNYILNSKTDQNNARLFEVDIYGSKRS